MSAKITHFIHRHLKSIRLITGILGLAVLLVSGYQLIPAPKIDEMGIIKLSPDSSLTLHFSQSMDKGSVLKTLSFSPKIKGAVEWTDGSTMEFHPAAPLVIGDEIEVTVGRGARSLYFKPLGMDVTVRFQVAGPPYVAFYSPATKDKVEDKDKELTIAPDQAITVMFDRPMSAETMGLKVGALLQTDPPAEGALRWIGDSAFQFTPTAWPMGRTIQLTIPAGLGSREGGVTKEKISWKLQTPALKVIESAPAAGALDVATDTPITLRFNQPVDLNDIKPGLNAQLFPSNDMDAAARNEKKDGFFNTDVTYGKGTDGSLDKTLLVFKPTFPYLSGQDIRFLLRAGMFPLTESGGLFPSAEDFELNFTTAGGKVATTETPPAGSAASLSGMAKPTSLAFFAPNIGPHFSVAVTDLKPIKLNLCAVSQSGFLGAVADGIPRYSCSDDQSLLWTPPAPAVIGSSVDVDLATVFKMPVPVGIYYFGFGDSGRFFQVSDTKLTLKKTDNAMVVWATDAVTGKSVDRMELRIFEGADPVAQGVTDGDGLFKLVHAFGSGLTVMGKKNLEGEHRVAIAREDSPSSLDVFNPGQNSPMVLFDKPRYEPGDTLRFAGTDFSEDKEIKVRVENPDEELLGRATLPVSAERVFSGQFPLPPNAVTGQYSLVLEKQEARQPFVVDPPQAGALPFIIDLISPKTDFSAGEPVSFDLRVADAFGVAPAGLRGHWSLTHDPLVFAAVPDAGRFSFGPLDDNHSGNAPIEGDLVFDANGSATLVFDEAHKTALAPRSKYHVRIQAEKDGNETSRAFDFNVLPGDFWLGLRAASSVVKEGEGLDLSFMAASPEGKFIEDIPVAMTLLQHDEVLKTDKSTTVSEVKTVHFPLPDDLKSGDYVVRAEAEGSRGQRVRAEIPVTLLRSVAGGASFISDEEIVPDQLQYFVGGKAHLLIVSRATKDAPEDAMLTVERGDVLQAQVVTLDSSDVWASVPITQEMVPRAKVTMTLADDREVSSWIIVSPRDREISVDLKLTTDGKDGTSPGQVQIRAMDYKNQPVVSQLIAEVTDASDDSSGGPVSVAYFNAKLTTDDGGQAVVPLELPASGGPWTLRVTAVSGGKKIGTAEIPLPVKKEVLIDPALPSMAVSGDALTVGAVVTNPTGKDLETQIELSADGFSVKGSSKQAVFIKAGEKKRIDWPVEVLPTAVSKTVTAAFRMPEGLKEQAITLLPPDGRHLISLSGLVPDAAEANFVLPPNMSGGLSQLVIGVAPTPLASLERVAAFIPAMPAASLEDQFSALLIDLALEKAARPSARPIDDRITALIAQQRADGGFSPFREPEDSDPTLSAYALFVFTLAKQQSHSVDEAMLTRLKNVLLSVISAGETTMPASQRAFISWALSEAGEYDTREALSIFKEREGLSVETRSYLLAELQNLFKAGQKSTAPFIDRLKGELADATGDPDHLYLAFSGDGLDNPVLPSLVTAMIADAPRSLKQAAWSALALATAAVAQKDLSADYDFKVLLNGASVLSGKMKTPMKEGLFTVTVPESRLRTDGRPNTLRIEKTGVGPLLYDAALQFFLSDLVQPEESSGVILSRVFFRPGDAAETPVTEATVGDELQGRLRLLVSKDSDNVTVSEILPAGLMLTRLDDDLADPAFSFAAQAEALRLGYDFIDNPVWNFVPVSTSDGRLTFYAAHLSAGVYTINFTAQAKLPGRVSHLPATLECQDPGIFIRTGSASINVMP